MPQYTTPSCKTLPSSFASVRYDPYSLRKAALNSLTPASFSQKLISTAFFLSILIFSALPIPILLLLPAYAYIICSPSLLLLAAFFWLWFLAFLAHNFRVFSAPLTPGSTQPKPTPGKKVIVIGAGPAGLAAVKECLAAGADVIAYERKNDVGGVYQFTKSFDGGVWKGCRLTTSPWVTAYSDFPPKSTSDRHLTHQAYHEYLRAYALHFHLRPRIKFRHRAVSIQRVGANEGWQVDVQNDNDGKRFVDMADFVIVCTGANTRPKKVPLPGACDFQGEIRHVCQYKGSEGLVGKKVLVIGNGESATEVAAEVGAVAKRTYLSIRRGKFILSRVNSLNGRARDNDTNRVRFACPTAIRNWYMRTQKRRIADVISRDDPVAAVTFQMLEASGLGATCQVATKTDDFIFAFLRDELEVRGEVVGFEGKKVVYRDGVKEEMDVVIYANGYEQTFPFLKLPEGVQMKHPGEMYLRMFMPKMGKSLMFCGFLRPGIGSIPPMAELQARYAGMIINGQRDIPSVTAMEAAVEDQIAEGKEFYPGIEQPSTVVSYLRYLDTIAEKIGCRPDPRKLLLDPVLMWKVMTGPVNGAAFRLHGPGASEVSMRTVMSLQGMHRLQELVIHVGLYFWYWPLSVFDRRRVMKHHNTLI